MVKEMTIQARLENISLVTAFIEEQLEALDCPMKAMTQIDVAIDELIGNIAHYAYPGGSGDVTIQFTFEESTRMATITFIDQGFPFDPLGVAEPDIMQSAEKRKIGGLGIFLVKKTMDAMEYRREDGKNILTIRKKI